MVVTGRPQYWLIYGMLPLTCVNRVSLKISEFLKLIVAMPLYIYVHIERIAPALYTYIIPISSILTDILPRKYTYAVSVLYCDLQTQTKMLPNARCWSKWRYHFGIFGRWRWRWLSTFLLCNTYLNCLGLIFYSWVTTFQITRKLIKLFMALKICQDKHLGQNMLCYHHFDRRCILYLPLDIYVCLFT